MSSVVMHPQIGASTTIEPGYAGCLVESCHASSNRCFYNRVFITKGSAAEVVMHPQIGASTTWGIDISEKHLIVVMHPQIGASTTSLRV